MRRQRQKARIVLAEMPRPVLRSQYSNATRGITASGGIECALCHLACDQVGGGPACHLACDQIVCR